MAIVSRLNRYSAMLEALHAGELEGLFSQRHKIIGT